MNNQHWDFSHRIHLQLITLFTSGLCAVLGCNYEEVSKESERVTPVKNPAESPPAKGFGGTSQTLCRLFWQDGNKGTICAADLCSTEDGFVTKQMPVEGLKIMDIKQNSFVQMKIVDTSLIVGVRDNLNGKQRSGWLVIDTGVEEESHGDHSHWHYNKKPKLLSEHLDTNQGNPAHVYRYGQQIYIAQDKNNGFTVVNSDKGRTSSSFFQGGGGHITIAALKGQIAYASWIDRAGENVGRIDVVDLRSNEGKPKYSFKLPTGGIHGATACGNRVFFAPSEGIDWVDCDFEFQKSNDNVVLNHLSLGDEENRGYRTGSFESFANHVICIANCKGCPPALCVIDGTTPSPKVSRLVYRDIEEGQRLSSLRTVTVSGKPYGLAFAESEEFPDKLLVFALDENGDRKFDDLKLVKSIDVGNSKVEGHSGHHGIDFVPDQNIAVITNPGDGTLQILDMNQWEITKTVQVHGKPTRIVAQGGMQ